MPRDPKPAANPTKMPRTEADLDRIMTAVENHMGEGSRLGRALEKGDLTTEQVLEQAGERDAKLYRIVNEVAVERSEEFEGSDEGES